jgi:hypothetical protein
VSRTIFIQVCFAVLGIGCLLAPIGCGSESSANLGSLNDSAKAHARDAALGHVAMCLIRHQPINLEEVRAECEHAGKDPNVRVHIEWATADAWGARASKEGMPGDCVDIAGWPTEAQYLFTSVEHRGAILGGSTCDGGKTVAPRSWPEFVQQSLAVVLGRELRGVRAYRTRHAGAFPPADSLHMHSDSLIRFRAVWARPDGIAIEAFAPALQGVSCVIWDGVPSGHAPLTTAGRQAAQAGVATCDDFGSANRAKS